MPPPSCLALGVQMGNGLAFFVRVRMCLSPPAREDAREDPPFLQRPSAVARARVDRQSDRSRTRPDEQHARFSALGAAPLFAPLRCRGQAVRIRTTSRPCVRSAARRGRELHSGELTGVWPTTAGKTWMRYSARTRVSILRMAEAQLNAVPYVVRALPTHR